mgnify:CR=1 FL=1
MPVMIAGLRVPGSLRCADSAISRESNRRLPLLHHPLYAVASRTRRPGNGLFADNGMMVSPSPKIPSHAKIRSMEVTDRSFCYPEASISSAVKAVQVACVVRQGGACSGERDEQDARRYLSGCARLRPGMGRGGALCAMGHPGREHPRAPEPYGRLSPCPPQQECRSVSGRLLCSIPAGFRVQHREVHPCVAVSCGRTGAERTACIPACHTRHPSRESWGCAPRRK